MTWTYDPTLATPKDCVRLLVGDVLQRAPLITDEAIGFFLQGAGLYWAAHDVAKAIQASFARLTDRSIGDISTEDSQRYEQYGKVAQYLAERAASSELRIYAGGLSRSEKFGIMMDFDRVRPFFTRLMNQPVPVAPFLYNDMAGQFSYPDF